MGDRDGIFAGDDPFEIARRWLSDAERAEPNDANAIALSTVDADGLPNARMVLLKEIEADAFVFYTNYESQKARELDGAGKAAFVMHWKSLRRQIRVRGVIGKEDGPQADAYYASRSLKSRLGAWASKQSQPLSGRSVLMAEVAKVTARHDTQDPDFSQRVRSGPAGACNGGNRTGHQWRWSADPGRGSGGPARDHR